MAEAESSKASRTVPKVSVRGGSDAPPSSRHGPSLATAHPILERQKSQAPLSGSNPSTPPRTPSSSLPWRNVQITPGLSVAPLARTSAETTQVKAGPQAQPGPIRAIKDQTNSASAVLPSTVIGAPAQASSSKVKSSMGPTFTPSRPVPVSVAPATPMARKVS